MGNAESEETRMKLMLLGLENTGKSTFLKNFLECRNGQQIDPKKEPTNGFNFLTLKLSDQILDIWDVGGDPTSRQFWSTYYRSTKITNIIYFINLKKKDTHTQSLKELITLLNEEELKQTRFCILFNPFLDKDEIKDETKNKQFQFTAKQLIDQLKQFPIYKYDTRAFHIIADVNTIKITDQYLCKLLGIKFNN